MRQPYPPNSSLVADLFLAEANLAKELGVKRCDLMATLKAKERAKAPKPKSKPPKKSKARSTPKPNPLLPLHDARKCQKPLPYVVYLHTEHWRITRIRMLKRAGRHCQQCGSTDRLQVHHLRYDTLWFECQADLRVLCKACHEITHGVFEYHA